MEAFINFVLQFGHLNKQQIDLIAGKGSLLELEKDDFYWEAGKMVRQIGFLAEGVLRVYYYTNTGEENTRYFIDENHLILDGPAPGGDYVPSEYLQAVTGCKLVVFSKKRLERHFQDHCRLGWHRSENNRQASFRKSRTAKSARVAGRHHAISQLRKRIPFPRQPRAPLLHRFLPGDHTIIP